MAPSTGTFTKYYDLSTQCLDIGGAVETAVSNGVAHFLDQLVELIKESLGPLELDGTVCRNIHKIPTCAKKIV
jgi:hypothetical protein